VFESFLVGFLTTVIILSRQMKLPKNAVFILAKLSKEI
jgi:hypothetical protein